jgi:hypothetical protein
MNKRTTTIVEKFNDEGKIIERTTTTVEETEDKSPQSLNKPVEDLINEVNDNIQYYIDNTKTSYTNTHKDMGQSTTYTELQKAIKIIDDKLSNLPSIKIYYPKKDND